MKIFCRNRIIDEINHPQLWSLPFSDNLYLQFMAQNLPLIAGLKKAIELFTVNHTNSNLLISARYIYSMRSGFPAYFSHRERLILCLNQLRIYNDIEEFKRWAEFEDNQEKSFYFSISIMIWGLNQAILNNEPTDEFKKIIHELKKANPHPVGPMGFVIKDFFLGLCHYLINEYTEAMKYIGPIKSYKGPAALVKAINYHITQPESRLSNHTDDQSFGWAA